MLLILWDTLDPPPLTPWDLEVLSFEPMGLCRPTPYDGVGELATLVLMLMLGAGLVLMFALALGLVLVLMLMLVVSDPRVHLVMVT